MQRSVSSTLNYDLFTVIFYVDLGENEIIYHDSSV